MDLECGECVSYARICFKQRAHKLPPNSATSSEHEGGEKKRIGKPTSKEKVALAPDKGVFSESCQLSFDVLRRGQY